MPQQDLFPASLFNGSSSYFGLVVGWVAILTGVGALVPKALCEIGSAYYASQFSIGEIQQDMAGVPQTTSWILDLKWLLVY